MILRNTRLRNTRLRSTRRVINLYYATCITRRVIRRRVFRRRVLRAPRPYPDTPTMARITTEVFHCSNGKVERKLLLTTVA